MVEAFLERHFDVPLDPAGLQQLAADSQCLALHKVAWHSSLLSADGHRLLCRFTGPDLESVRVSLRQSGSDISNLWSGSVHDAPGTSESDQQASNVLVERRFDEPVTVRKIQAMEDAGAWCLEAHRVTFLRTCFSTDRKRMLCLYRAPDAESVRLAQRQAHMPFDQVWAFTRFEPAR